MNLPEAIPSRAYRTDAERWRAVQRRDRHADDRFVYSVSTTGVYCRPTCAARRPKREHVAFFPDCAAAEAAGFRACKRCHPSGPSPAQREADLVVRACRLLEAAESPPLLADLARACRLSPHHFHRLFRQATGVTPREYFARRRSGRMRQALRRGPSVTAAIYDSGFGSSSRFYEKAADQLGMSPTQFRRGAAGEEIGFSTARSTLGWVLAAGTARGLCAVFLGDDARELERALHEEFPRARLRSAGSEASAWLQQIVGEIEKPSGCIDLPLDIQGTAFQQRVWQALREIPSGETRTYSELAAAVGAPHAVRAVAGACANNPLALVVPCHRVVRRGGHLAGYRWGLERKRELLRREKAGRSGT